MKIELRILVDENEMLSHIFLGCIPKDKLLKIKEQFVGKSGEEKDWQRESVKIPVEMKIGGVSVNPKEFFDSWKNQMGDLIAKKANKLLSEKMGSEKIRQLQGRLYEFEQVLDYLEKDVNWNVPNPLVSDEASLSSNEEELRNSLIDEIVAMYVPDGNPENWLNKIQALRK